MGTYAKYMLELSILYKVFAIKSQFFYKYETVPKYKSYLENTVINIKKSCRLFRPYHHHP